LVNQGMPATLLCALPSLFKVAASTTHCIAAAQFLEAWIMKRRQFTHRALALLGASAAVLASPSMALAQQAYPNRPVRILIGQASGGAVDTVARLLSERLTASLGVSVVVEARPGAAGMIAADAVARSLADGYTLGLLDVGALAVNPSLQPKISYDIAKDFSYLGGVAKIPLVLVAHPSATANTLADLTKYASTNPGRLSYASAGVGSPLHLAFEAYKQRAGIFVTHVPYRGGAPALADVAAGHVPLIFIDTNLTNQFSKSGKVKPLAIATSERSPLLPDVPTFAEAGISNFDYAPWLGLVSAAGMDAQVASRLNQAVQQVINSPELAQQVRALGFMSWPLTQERFAAHVKAEASSYRELIKVRGIKIEP
jgi:tripartite-type tricarboxylate transporter receptor subunit TctC